MLLMIKRLLFLLSFVLILSSMGFAQWEQLTNFASGQVYCFADKGTTLYSGGYCYFASSPDSGVTWNSSYTGITSYSPISGIVVGSNYMLAGTYGTSYRST